MNNKKRRPTGRTTKPILKVLKIEVGAFNHALIGGLDTAIHPVDDLPSEAMVIDRAFSLNVGETIAALMLALGGVHSQSVCESERAWLGQQHFQCYRTSAGMVHVEPLSRINSVVMVRGRSCLDIDRVMHDLASDKYRLECRDADLEFLKGAPKASLIEEALKVHTMSDPSFYGEIEVDRWLATLVSRRLASSSLLADAITRGVSDAKRLLRATKASRLVESCRASGPSGD